MPPPCQLPVTIDEAEFNRPWPRWTKLATARLLQILFPSVAASKWLGCFESKEPLEAVLAVFEGGHLLGRTVRCFTELRENDPQNFQLLSQNRWVKGIRNRDGKVDIEYGEGIYNLVLHCMEDVMHRPAEDQKKFWRSFGSNFGKKLVLRLQDKKAIRIYLFLIVTWPHVQRCTSISELYAYVFKCIPKDPCPPGTDPIDFEERQVKWFEKLCDRNLGLRLAKRGRPAQKK